MNVVSSRTARLERKPSGNLRTATTNTAEQRAYLMVLIQLVVCRLSGGCVVTILVHPKRLKCSWISAWRSVFYLSRLCRLSAHWEWKERVAMMRGRRGSCSGGILGLSKVRFCPFSTFKLNIQYILLSSLDFRIISALSANSFKSYVRLPYRMTRIKDFENLL